ncbi:MAG: glycosyltransferase family 2 protein [Ginsengibacter sp.]
MDKKSIAVLITSHNRRDKTLTCVEKLFLQEGIDIEFGIKVFLVDDGSTDGTAEAVAKRFPEVNIIPGNGDLYWNRGMHLAWSVALKEGFDYYFWLNDDTILYTACLSELIKCMLTANGNSIIVGTTRSEISGEPTYGGRKKNKELIVPNGQLQLCDYFNGNCVLIPGRVSDIIGNLDYNFRHSMGDYDYGRRAGKKGIRSYIAYGYAGSCEKHESLSKWCSPSVGLFDRIKAFNTPLAVNPVQHFIYDYRHNGLITAVTHFITIHLRLLFPVLWEGRHNLKSKVKQM